MTTHYRNKKLKGTIKASVGGKNKRDHSKKFDYSVDFWFSEELPYKKVKVSKSEYQKEYYYKNKKGKLEVGLHG
jgi:hypothetical protein